MSKTGKTYATWAISAAVAAGLALGGTLAVAADKGRAAQTARGLIEADWLIGTDLHDADGNHIGTITDLRLDPENGRVRDVIVSVGETPGAASPRTAPSR